MSNKDVRRSFVSRGLRAGMKHGSGYGALWWQRPGSPEEMISGLGEGKGRRWSLETHHDIAAPAAGGLRSCEVVSHTCTADVSSLGALVLGCSKATPHAASL